MASCNKDCDERGCSALALIEARRPGGGKYTKEDSHYGNPSANSNYIVRCSISFSLGRLCRIGQSTGTLRQGVRGVTEVALPSRSNRLTPLRSSRWNRLQFHGSGIRFLRICWTTVSIFPGSLGPLDLRIEPSIPNDDGQTTTQHQHRKVPQSVIAKACACTKDDQDAGYLVPDSLFRQLHGGNRNNPDSGSVEPG